MFPQSLRRARTLAIELAPVKDEDTKASGRHNDGGLLDGSGHGSGGASADTRETE